MAVRIERKRLLRACLTLCAARAPDFDRAAASGADALLLDLRGSDRARARLWAAQILLRARELAAPPAYLRCGPVESPEIAADLAALLPAAPAGIFLERAESRASVQHLSAKLAVAEAEAGLADGQTKIVGLAAQTPAGVFKLETFAGCSPRLAGLAFEPGPLAAALGVGADAPPIALARSLLVLAARAAGVPAIEGAEADRAALAAACARARAEGFSGKLAANPAEIGVIAATFAGAIDKRP